MPTPRSDQKKAVDDAIRGFKTSDRGRVVMPCGTGKTFVGMLIMQKIVGKTGTALVLVPSLGLIDQVVKDYAEDCPFEYDALIVCSDKDAGVDRFTDDQDAIPDFTGYDVTTDPDRIRAFLRGRGKRPRIVFCTYASSKQLEGCEFKFALFDEAHRVTGDRRKRWAVCLDDTFTRIAKRLFMTATPRIVRDMSTSNAETKSYSMDDESEHFGPIFYNMTFGEAVRLKLIVDYTIVCMTTTDNDDSYEYVGTDSNGKPYALDRATVAAHHLLAKAQRKYKFTRCITFHNRVDRAAAFASLAPKKRDFVSGVMGHTERNGIIEALKLGKVNVVANAHCLAEGVNIVEADAVCFAEPRKSVPQVVQAVGRVLRLSAGTNKERAYIIVPIRLPHPNIDQLDPDEVRGAFRVTAQVLAALRSVDPELDDLLKRYAASAGKPSTRSSSKPSPEEAALRRKLDIVLPPSVTKAFKSIDAKIVQLGGASWEQRYGELKAELEANGGDWKKAYKRLPWLPVHLRNWRQAKRGLGTTKSTPEREKLLEELPGWNWRPRGSYNQVDMTSLPLGEMADKEIARQYGLSNYVVGRARKRAGIPRATSAIRTAIRNVRWRRPDATRLRSVLADGWPSSRLASWPVNHRRYWSKRPSEFAWEIATYEDAYRAVGAGSTWTSGNGLVRSRPEAWFSTTALKAAGYKPPKNAAEARKRVEREIKKLEAAAAKKAK